MRFFNTILSVTLLTFPGQFPCQAKPSDLKKFAGSYVGSFTKGVLRVLPPGIPGLTTYLPNRFFIRLPAGKGTARGGFGLQNIPGDTTLLSLKQKIKKATVRQGGRKAILTGTSTVTGHTVPPLTRGRFRAILKQRSKGVTYESNLKVAPKTLPIHFTGKFKARS